MTQKLGLEVDGVVSGSRRSANTFRRTKIDFDALDDKGGKFLHIVATKHGDPRPLQVDVDEIAAGNSALELAKDSALLWTA